MKIVAALKLPDEYVRVVNGNRSLIHNCENFIVYEHKVKKKRHAIVYKGVSEDVAVAELLKAEQ